LPDTGRGVLITRPEPGGSETAARVAALGYRPVAAPLLDIHVLDARLPAAERLHAILVTSGNAIPSLPASHRHLPLLAVGAATAARARDAGFTQVNSADGDANALAELAARSCDPRAGPLLLASGRGQGEGLAGDLRARGFRVVRRVVYVASPASALPDVARLAFASGGLEAALFFSAETARQCVRLLQAARLREAVRSVNALAIGQAAAVALQALPWRRICVAARPNQDAMLALLR
jgi:uroporphyrinogen-III synthase